jgi:hypothetical protein
MPIQNFRASVQYDDFKGTAAADRADRGDASDWLEEKGLKQKGEFLLGLTFYAGENHGKHEDPIYAEFLLALPGDHDTVKSMIETSAGPLPVRKVTTQMTLVEFFGLFKRFSVHLSAGEMLNGQEYTYGE